MALLCVALCGTLLNILMVQNYCNFRVFVFDVYTSLSPHSMVKFYVNCKQEPTWKWSLVTENAIDTNRCYEIIFNDMVMRNKRTSFTLLIHVNNIQNSLL